MLRNRCLIFGELGKLMSISMCETSDMNGAPLNRKIYGIDLIFESMMICSCSLFFVVEKELYILFLICLQPPGTIYALKFLSFNN
ncbi:hypothetical protein Hdeb2414_s0121g00803271 [Helianthus debilis subsp. tardiflorus]